MTYAVKQNCLILQNNLLNCFANCFKHGGKLARQSYSRLVLRTAQATFVFNKFGVVVS